MSETKETIGAVQPIDLVKVQLDSPIKRGNELISSIGLRRPKAGALRGLSLMDVAQMDVAALVKLLPRISEPTLTEHDVRNMGLEDLTALGVEVAGFLAQKSMKEGFQE